MQGLRFLARHVNSVPQLEVAKWGSLLPPEKNSLLSKIGDQRCDQKCYLLIGPEVCLSATVHGYDDLLQLLVYRTHGQYGYVPRESPLFLPWPLLKTPLVSSERFTDTSAPLPRRPLVTSAPSHLGPNHLGPGHLGPSHFDPMSPRPLVTRAPFLFYFE